MKLFAPSYYKDFICIADKCRHSCCIGWEIGVDDDTFKKYRSLDYGYGREIAGTVEENPYPHFKMCEDGRCPHLDDSGLCRIISALGDGYLAEICREHPRFYNILPDRAEVGLGLSCEEAARLALLSDGYEDVREIGNIECEGCSRGFSALEFRRNAFGILRDRSRPYNKRLSMLSDYAGVSPLLHTDDEWREIFKSLEYLHSDTEELFLKYSSSPIHREDKSEIFERFLGYLIYRHCSDAECESELRASFGFCLLLERLLVSCSDSSDTEGILDTARIISEEIEYNEDNTEELKLEFY